MTKSMIVFLNFAPFRFMGGAEKWAYETAQVLSNKDRINLISVSDKIANIYSKIILKRKFDIRVNSLETQNIKEYEISYMSFIPFSSKWKAIRSNLLSAEKIYIKFEVLELTLLIYFCGIGILKKTIAGIHTPYIYADPISFFDRLHNKVYASSLSKLFLSKFNKIHVITLRDFNLFTKRMNLKNVTFVPNSINVNTAKNKDLSKSKNFNVVFVGELIPRKGIDVLKKIIEKSDSTVHFNIVGNGPLQTEIIDLAKKKKNCTYYGYLNKEELNKLYMNANVLLLPSRAEGFPLVYHEALKNGLIIVDSNDVNVGLPDDIEYSASNRSPQKYANILKQLRNNKNKKQTSEKIISYYEKNLSFAVVKNSIRKELFS